MMDESMGEGKTDSPSDVGKEIHTEIYHIYIYPLSSNLKGQPRNNLFLRYDSLVSSIR